MRTGILINPEDRSIIRVEVPYGTSASVLETIYRHLDIHERSRIVEVVNLRRCGFPSSDELLVDEEARLRYNQDTDHSFWLGNPEKETEFRTRVIGRALVLRTNHRAQWVSPKVPLPRLTTWVRWNPPLHAGPVLTNHGRTVAFI